MQCRTIFCLLFLWLACSAHAIEGHRKLTITGKEAALHRVHGGTHERSDEELAQDISNDNWDRIRDAAVEIGKMFEETERVFGGVEKGLEYFELAKKIKAVGETVEAMNNVGPDGASKLEALKMFVHCAAEVIPIPGVHQFLLAYSAIIGNIIESFNAFQNEVRSKTTQLTKILHPGLMEGGVDLYNTFNHACKGGPFVLTTDVKSWFYEHKDILRAYTGVEVWKVDNSRAWIVKKLSGARSSDVAVMTAWIQTYWPIAALVAYGRTAEGIRFCLCNSDPIRGAMGFGDCHTY
jgi:hypothetical protein